MKRDIQTTRTVSVTLFRSGFTHLADNAALQAMAHASQVLAAQLLRPLGAQRNLENDWTSSLVICRPHRFLWSCDMPTTESLPPLLVSKMPKILATAVLPPNGLSKDGMILQQFRCIPKKTEECKSSQDLPHSSIVTVAATIVVHKLLLSSSPGASESVFWSSSCSSGSFIFVGLV